MLYLLKKRNDVFYPDSPWGKPHDCVMSMVVRASCVSNARSIASQYCGDEGSEAWVNSKWSTCEFVDHEGEPGVIIADILEG